MTLNTQFLRKVANETFIYLLQTQIHLLITWSCRISPIPVAIRKFSLFFHVISRNTSHEIHLFFIFLNAKTTPSRFNFFAVKYVILYGEYLFLVYSVEILLVPLKKNVFFSKFIEI